MRLLIVLAVTACLLRPGVSHGFSVLAHQAVVDAAWEPAIVPALRQRFPGLGADELSRARAFAYGGSHIPDLGYFPFGSRLFSDLLHYVRSGDFFTQLVASATTPDEYAFALGALSHYVTDATGHPEATNPTVGELYPDLRREFGPRPTYADDPSAHLQTEFRFDVLEVSRSRQSPDLIHHAIAFEVSEPVLERAFVATYGLRLHDVFADTAIAIRTYRWAFREVIHEATGIAWELYRADIEKLDPEATPERFVANLSRTDFAEEFGKAFREPGYLAKFVAFLVKLVPNVGPLKRLPYKALPADARARFVAALDHAIARYREDVARARARDVHLPDTNLDVGRPTRPGEYEPADEAYATLLVKLDEHDFADVPPGLRADVLRFYGEGAGRGLPEDDDDAQKVRRALARLQASGGRAARRAAR